MIKIGILNTNDKPIASKSNNEPPGSICLSKEFNDINNNYVNLSEKFLTSTNSQKEDHSMLNMLNGSLPPPNHLMKITKQESKKKLKEKKKKKKKIISKENEFKKKKKIMKVEINKNKK